MKCLVCGTSADRVVPASSSEQVTAARVCVHRGEIYVHADMSNLE